MRRLSVLALLVCGALQAETVVVLPFFNHSKSQNLDWIGESIAEAVQDSLASEGLLVLSRDDRLEAYRRQSLRAGAEITHASVIKIGESLDASQVVYGYYELLPAGEDNAPPAGKAAPPLKGSLRVTARVLDLKHTRQSASFSEMAALEDLAQLQARLGWQVLETISPKTAPPEADFLKARPPVRVDAVENYVRGLLASAPDQRQRFFLQATRLDEHYSQPCFQLGKGYWEKKEYKLAETWLARVAASDQHYLEAQFFLGLSRYHNGDFAGAEAAFQTVAAAVPLNEVFNNLGAAELRQNNFGAAAASFQKALDGDSGDPDYHFNLGYTLWLAGQPSAAADRFRAAAERNPSDSEATLMLGRALKGDTFRPSGAKGEDRLRLKTNYDEAAYRQLQAELKK
jgi:tetratricopeptide (TPR) repeat protein